MSEAKQPIKRKSEFDLSTYAPVKIPTELYGPLVKEAIPLKIHWSELVRLILREHINKKRM